MPYEFITARRVGFMDLSIIRYVQNHFHNEFTDTVFPFLSRIGNAGAVWLSLAIYVGLRFRSRNLALMLCFALALSHILSLILKQMIGRPRPFVTHPVDSLLIHRPGGYSCPSGHSASSFAAATVLLTGNGRIGAAALVLALLIAFSRVFVFVHYPSDTVFGALIGVFSAFLVLFLCAI